MSDKKHNGDKARPVYKKGSAAMSDKQTSPNSPKKKKKKMSRVKIVILIVLAVLAAILIGVGTWAAMVLGSMNVTSISSDNSSLQISDDPIFDAPDDERVINIALFGLDSRDLNSSDDPRSDAIIILSIDRKHDKIKMTSVMRDCNVEMEVNGQVRMDKLAHAYHYGGPELAIATLNRNFNLDIRKFAAVNFDQMAEIIDAVGGVTIDISEAERQNANQAIREQASISGKSATLIEHAGEQKLNGMQAVAYARIRAVGNADFGRVDRQKVVMEQLFKAALNMSVTDYPGFVQKLLPKVTTNITVSEMLTDYLGIFLRSDLQIEQIRIPQDVDLNGSINGNLNVDLEASAQKVRDFIYNDINPEEASGASGSVSTTK